MVYMPVSEIFSVVPGRQGQITKLCLYLNRCAFVIECSLCAFVWILGVCVCGLYSFDVIRTLMAFERNWPV